MRHETLSTETAQTREEYILAYCAERTPAGQWGVSTIFQQDYSYATVSAALLSKYPVVSHFEIECALTVGGGYGTDSAEVQASAALPYNFTDTQLRNVHVDLVRLLELELHRYLLGERQ